jgi:hypothetical protein
MSMGNEGALEPNGSGHLEIMEGIADEENLRRFPIEAVHPVSTSLQLASGIDVPLSDYPDKVVG